MNHQAYVQLNLFMAPLSRLLFFFESASLAIPCVVMYLAFGSECLVLAGRSLANRLAAPQLEPNTRVSDCHHHQRNDVSNSQQQHRIPTKHKHH